MLYHYQLEQLVAGNDLAPTPRILCFAATAGSVNNMQALETAIQFSIENNIATHVELYEALLQTYLFAGFPAALESLSVLHNYLENNNLKILDSSYDIPNFSARGENLCRSIYTNVYDKMRSKLGKVSPELDQWMIIEGYGKTLSRPGIPTKTRELISASSLAALGWENQLYSHIRGAVNVGASHSECRALLAGLRLLCDEVRYKRTEIIMDTVLEAIQ